LSDRQASESQQRDGARTADDARRGTEGGRALNRKCVGRINERRIARVGKPDCRIGKNRIAGNCRKASGKPTARRRADSRRGAKRQRGESRAKHSGGKTFWGYIRGRSNWLGGRSNERGSNGADRRVLRTIIESQRDELRTRFCCFIVVF